MAQEDDIVVITQVIEPPPPEEGLPPWMATFADMVTLLLCFFVLLLSFANMETANMRMLLGVMTDSFGVQFVDSTSMHMAYSDDTKQFRTTMEREADIKQIAASLKKFIDTQDMESETSVTRYSTGVMLRVGNQAMFEPGSSKINPAAVSILVEVVKILMSGDFNLMIRGHTDGEDLSKELLDSNWELSATRSAACLRWILDKSRVKPNRLKAAGFAGSKPLVPSTTAQNKATNRRVEFYFVPPGDPNW